MVIKKRILVFYVFVIISFTVFSLRLGYVKVIKNKEYYERALDLWTRSAPISGCRGNIYDCNQKLIVGSIFTPTVVAIPHQIKDANDASTKISKILNCSKTSIYKHLNKSVSVEIIKPEAKKISVEKAKEILKLNIDGIYVVSDNSRYYPYDDILSQVIGVVGIDNQGLSGIEYIYDDILKGTQGSLEIFTDAHGDMINDYSGYYKPSKKGNDLVLTINLDIQLSLERVLENAYLKYTPNDVIGIVMDPRNSEILAMASRPTFNPKNFKDYDVNVYNRNLPIWKSYEPGSTFKICTFSAGLEEKVFRLDEKFFDPGYMIVDGIRIRDWKKGGHGSETFLQVLENSCNPGFMTIGLRLGKDRLFKYIKAFGYGSKTGIDLLGESSGIIFKESKVGNVELATSSFGQGNSATPLQIINAGAAAVTGGNLNKPYILKSIKYTNGTSFTNEKVVIRNVISEETSKIVASSLESVVAKGTGRTAYIDGYRVGGKTGTAQIARNGRYVDGEFILSFLAYAPMNDPVLGVYISIENAHNAIQYGGTTVGPLVKEVLSDAIGILGIKKNNDGIPYDTRLWIDKPLYEVKNYVGKTAKEIKRTPYYSIVIRGDGEIIIDQMPEAGEKIIENGTIILYT